MVKTKISITIAVMLLFMFAMSAVSNAQTGKMGYVDSDKIFAEYEDWTRAQEEFNTQYKAWEEEAQNKQTELEDLIQEYEKQKLILSVDKKAEREAQIQAKQSGLDAYTREIFGPNGTAERKNNTLVKPLLEKINAAIEKVSTEENYDFVFNSAGLAYAKQGFDITDKVLKALEEE